MKEMDSIHLHRIKKAAIEKHIPEHFLYFRTLIILHDLRDVELLS